ncbi:MAG: hypothetical protein GXY75_04375 [Bacteroidales bacterium]|jgi:hypothetical protein|nr:hypothetical protein [Bacteroidales bacterium]
MKIRAHIFLLTLLMVVTACDPQRQIHIDTTEVSYFNGITGKNEIMESYRITNNSDEDYFTWVSLEPINERTNTELIHDYFKKRKGDFSFLEAMFENLLDEQPTVIGYSFIKNINPGETFHYFIAKNEKSSVFYLERIVLIKRKEVEQYLRMQIDDKCFYESPSIILTEK